MDLNLFVWNVFKGQKKEFFENDFSRLTKQADFILLQEAMLDQKMPDLWQKNHPQHHWKMAASFEYTKNNIRTGVATGSRIQALDIMPMRTAFREFFFLTPKISLFSYYQIQDTSEKLLLINTHAINFTTTKVFHGFLLELIPAIAKHQGPLILAGDFNTWNSQRMKTLSEILSPFALQLQTFEVDQRLLRLDHIFLRGFDVQTANILSDVKSSDHFPLQLKLRLKG